MLKKYSNLNLLFHVEHWISRNHFGMLSVQGIIRLINELVQLKILWALISDRYTYQYFTTIVILFVV